MNFAVLADLRVKLKESEKKDKYLDIAREMKKLWNMKATVVPIVISALGTVTKSQGVNNNNNDNDKEYKIGHDWVGKVILWELCKKFIFDCMIKWYMHNSESVLENEMNKILWDKEIQTDHLISARRPSDRQQQKREPAELWTLKETVIPTAIGALGTVTKGLVQGLENLEIRGPALLKTARILRRVLET